MGPLRFFPEASSFFLPGNFGKGGDNLSAVLSFFFCVPKRRNKKKTNPPSSSLQKNGSGVKKFGFKNNHTSENVPLVPKFGLERWGGR